MYVVEATGAWAHTQVEALKRMWTFQRRGKKAGTAKGAELASPAAGTAHCHLTTAPRGGVRGPAPCLYSCHQPLCKCYFILC